MLRRINHTGSVVVFAFIGVILSIGLVFFIYTLGQRSQQAQKELAVIEYERKQNSQETFDDSLVNSNDENNSIIAEKDSVASKYSIDSTIAAELPLTGSTFSPMNFIGLFFIVFFIMSYAVSQKYRRPTSLT